MPTMLGRLDPLGKPYLNIRLLEPDGFLRCHIDIGYKGFFLMSQNRCAQEGLTLRRHAMVSDASTNPRVWISSATIEWFGMPERFLIEVAADSEFGFGGVSAIVGFLPFWHQGCKLELDWSAQPNMDGGVIIHRP